MTLGQNIQTARKAKGMSQEALAERIGISRQALGKWEKDTALPGLDNLQALAAELGTGVDALLGAQAESPEAPAVTLDALRDLLAARDAEEKRRRRLWGGAAGAAFLVLAGLLAGTALQYERQIDALNQNYAAIQASYAAGSWMPVQVQVTPRTAAAGTSARLAVRCGDDTQLYEMTAAPDGSFAAQGIVFTVGSTYDLSVQWTADSMTTSEGLGTVDFNDEMTEPTIVWGAAGSSLDFGYSVRRVGNKQYRLTLTCYPVEVQVDAPPWMQLAQVEIDLRLNGDAGEPTATAVLDCEGEYSYGNSSRTESVWNGTFYDDAVINGWEYDGETLPKYVVRVTDTNGNVWTEEMPLTEK